MPKDTRGMRCRLVNNSRNIRAHLLQDPVVLQVIRQCVHAVLANIRSHHVSSGHGTFDKFCCCSNLHACMHACICT